MQEINRFSVVSLKWSTENFFSAIVNFCTCPLIVSIPHSYLPLADYRIDQNRSLHTNGVLDDIVRSVSKKLNFTIVYSPHDTAAKKTSSPHEIMLQTLGYDTLGRARKLNNTFLSTAFIQQTTCFLIPLGELYTPLEKLFLPFDLETWIFLSTFYIIGLAVICITKLTSVTIRKFVFGRDVQTPTLNFLRVIFGYGQMVLPGRNFARYILMNFILFCLVMRTAYQGKMFEFMQKDMRKPVIQTIREMIEQNFTIFTFLKTNRLIDFEIMRGANYYIFQFEEVADSARKLGDPANKMAFVVYKETYQFVLSRWGPYAKPALLKECLFSEMVGLQHAVHSISYFAIDNAIRKMFEGGITDFYLSKYNEEAKRREFHPRSGPKVFSMSELSIGFKIWLGCLVICVAAFVLELITFRVQNMIVRIKVSLFRI